MSGGSFDYLCEATPADIASRHLDALRALVER